MSDELNSFFDDEVVEEVEAEAEVTPEVEAETADDSTVETSEEEAPAAETSEDGSTTEPEKPTGKDVPLAALLDERDKRQKLQSQLDELTAANAEKPEVPSVFDDEQGFVASIKTELQQERLNDKLNLSELYARKNTEDFDNKWPEVEVFIVESGLHADVINHADPYGHAFELFAAKTERDQLSDPAHREKMKAELRAEVLKELEAEKSVADTAKAKKDAIAESLTPSLAGQKATGANTVVAQTVDDPLETTFNR